MLFRDYTNGEADGIQGLRSFRLQQEHDDLPAADNQPEGPVSGPLEHRPQEKEAQKQAIQDNKGQEILPNSAPDTSDHSESLRPVAETSSRTQPENGAEPAANPAEESSNEPIADSQLNALPTESSLAAVVDTSQEPGKGRLARPEEGVDPAVNPEKEGGDRPVTQSIANPASTESSFPAVEGISQEPGKGRSEISKDPLAPKIYWSKLPEHFPVPSASVIQLPTGKPKQLPTIQHAFADESANDKIIREQKLDKIKKTFEFSWAGYKEKAWMEDELSPVSGKSRNPFCGWAATLVDSLDTLWMMDMKEEFEEAVNSVKDINFTTSERKDIPLFETVIRYLGGLLSAYDLSGGAYRILLDKAVELAEVLMGAFDTPNRMPIAYYYWKP